MVKAGLILLLFTTCAMAQVSTPTAPNCSAPNNCFYISSAGADANLGTKVSPWLHAPKMNGWTGAHVAAANDVYVFKGGETFPISTTGICETTNTVKYTSDPTYFTGGGWTAPKIDGQSTLLNDGSGSCAGRHDLVELVGNEIYFGDVEVTGYREKLVFSATGGNHYTPTSQRSIRTTGIGNTINNVYVHNETLPAYTTYTDGINPTSPVCDAVEFGVGVAGTSVLSNSTINNLDGSPTINSVVATAGVGIGIGTHNMTVSNVTVKYHQSITSGAGTMGRITGSSFDWIAKPASFQRINGAGGTQGCPGGQDTHENGIYAIGTQEVDHNYFGQNIASGAGLWFPHPESDGANNVQTFSFHDNVLDLGTGRGGSNASLLITAQAITGTNHCLVDGTGTLCTVIVDNNTFATSQSALGPLIQFLNTGALKTFNIAKIQNNHLISNAVGTSELVCYAGDSSTSGCGGLVLSAVNTLTYTALTYSSGSSVLAGNNYRETVAQANTDGYTSGNIWFPQTGAPTIAAGVNVSADLGTNGALSYNGIVRPGTPDIGAYQYVAPAGNYLVTIAGAGSGSGTACTDGATCTDGILNAISTAGVISGTSTHTFTAGATATLTGTATTGTFVSFSGGGCSTSPCTITVNSPLTITATFQAPVSCTLTLAANSLNSPATVSATTALTGLSGANSFWFVLDPLSVSISVCNYPYSGCAAAGQSGNLPYTVSGLYSLGACSNGVCCTGSTAPLNINTGAGSAAH